MKSKDGHVTMPTEDHHGNTSVKVHGHVLIYRITRYFRWEFIFTLFVGDLESTNIV